jgi:hypothetical protein
MVLHTDQPHPHVHMVVKAESDEGQRLRIGKEKLRQWRDDFARMMREQGIAANATSRSILIFPRFGGLLTVSVRGVRYGQVQDLEEIYA